MSKPPSADDILAAYWNERLRDVHQWLWMRADSHVRLYHSRQRAAAMDYVLDKVVRDLLDGGATRR